MGIQSTRVLTQLTTKECAALFQEAAGRSGSRVARTLGKMGAHDSNAFFTPQDDSPFSSLDDDKPDFMVGTGVSKFNGGGKGNASFVHMYVWERESGREVVLSCAYGPAGGFHARKSVDGFVRAFQQADPKCRVEKN